MGDTRSKKEKEQWKCMDCGKDTFLDDKDYYMVKHEIWEKLVGTHGMLCMNCMEGRLGHPLRKEEILPCVLNEKMNPYTKAILNGSTLRNRI